MSATFRPTVAQLLGTLPTSEVLDAIETVRLIDALREDQGHSVELICDNEDGPPNYAVDVCGEFTGWEEERFTSDLSVLDCLRQAHAAMMARQYGGEVQWEPYDTRSFNPTLSGYTAGHYHTGSPEHGWCLFLRGRVGLEQRTKPALPPVPGAFPILKGTWLWMLPSAPVNPEVQRALNRIEEGWERITEGTSNSGDLVWNKDQGCFEPVDSINEHVSEYLCLIRLKTT